MWSLTVVGDVDISADCCEKNDILLKRASGTIPCGFTFRGLMAHCFSCSC